MRIAVIIHRISVSHVTDALGRPYPDTFDGVRRFFREHQNWQRPAYHVVVDRTGRRHQWAPLLSVVNGVYGWNGVACHVAAIGDWTVEDPPLLQWAATVYAAADVAYATNVSPSGRATHRGRTVPAIAGHGEVAAKRCPGERWDMRQFRAEVALRATVWPRLPLEERERLTGLRP